MCVLIQAPLWHNITLFHSGVQWRPLRQKVCIPCAVIEAELMLLCSNRVFEGVSGNNSPPTDTLQQFQATVLPGPDNVDGYSQREQEIMQQHS